MIHTWDIGSMKLSLYPKWDWGTFLFGISVGSGYRWVEVWPHIGFFSLGVDIERSEQERSE